MNQSDCLFCKIGRGEVPCYKIYEDQKYLAFLDIRPLTPGHTLVIPKEHFKWVWDVKPAGEYFEVITKVANHFRAQLGDEFLMSLTHGEGVPHAHYHLVPRGEGSRKVVEAGVGASYKLEEKEAKEVVNKLQIK